MLYHDCVSLCTKGDKLLCDKLIDICYVLYVELFIYVYMLNVMCKVVCFLKLFCYFKFAYIFIYMYVDDIF